MHTIALQVPITEISRNGNLPTNPGKRPGAVIGVWASASRRKSRMFDKAKGAYVGHGPWEQVSRLGNPLFNEVIVPMAHKDNWNARAPKGDKDCSRSTSTTRSSRRLLPDALPGRLPPPRGATTRRGPT